MTPRHAPRPSTPTPQMRGRYLMRNRVGNLALRGIDAVLARVPRTAPRPIPSAPTSVLLGIGGQLGDAVLASTTVSAVRRLLPAARIGVIGPSPARLVLEGHPDVARLHVLDHWAVSRTRASVADRVRQYQRDARRVAAEVRDAGYEVAFDLYPFFPNSSRVLHGAGIPIRVGFTSAGFGALYTHPVEYHEHSEHAIVHQVRLIASHLGVDPRAIDGLVMPPAARGVRSEGYVVLHMAGATPEREWPVDRWRTLVAELVREGRIVKCTGLAGREAALTQAVIDGLEGCENLCGALDWSAFVRVVSAAEAVVCIDTATAHVAAAAGVPVVALTAGIGRIPNFRPYAQRAIALTHPVSCAPCYRRAGCDEMACMRGVSVDDARAALRTVCA
jgi:ADP-heptose:LPS heptosyltransferase